MDSGRRLAGPKFCGQPYFAGEVEPRINGQVAASGAYFGQDGERIVDRLLGEQLVDDGWNCEVENGSTRAPFDTTLCVLEALIEYELAGASCDPVRIGAVTAARWLLGYQHPGRMPVDLGEGEGRPSRWNTLCALRALKWWAGGG